MTKKLTHLASRASATLMLAILSLTAAAQNAAIDNIMTRTSVRSYLPTPIEDGKIDTLLRAGMAAPTAVNKQPWHFVVVTDRAVLDALASTSPRGGLSARAPLAIAVCGDMSKALTGNGRDFWVQDVSAATENILLAAHALGLGAVWTGVYPAKERCEAMSKVLQLPETIVPLSLVVIGYPDGPNTPKNKYKAENVSYNVYGGSKE